MFDFTQDEAFKQILREKEKQILIRTGHPIQESDNYKRLHLGLIKFCKDNSPNDFIALLINLTDIEQLSDDAEITVPLNLDINHIVVDKEFKTVATEKRNISPDISPETYYKDLSKNICVFLISPEGVNPFIEGENVGQHVFFKKADYLAYRKLADVTDIWDLFEEFRQHIKIRNIYSNFFVANSGKRSLYNHLKAEGRALPSEADFLDQNQHLLNNKPEDRFRECLRLFLKDKLKNTVQLGKEQLLENFKRLDIYIFDDYGDLHLIEVKWVGISIHANGNKIGTEYTADDINPAAINQVLDYVSNLLSNNANIKVAYLAVFDARNLIHEDTCDGFDPSGLGLEEKKHYARFRKIPDFIVENRHPQ